MGKKKAPLSGLLKITSLAFVVSLILLFVAGRKKIELPGIGALLPALKQDPKQRSTKIPPFAFKYRGGEFLVKPVADYELWGLVVSHNNIHSIGDMYHDRDSVDLKDLCVLWGYNTESENYKKMQFWSDPWTCFIRTNSSEVFGEFEQTQFSNNHLISDVDKVLDRIRSAKIGDQVHLKGMLVNYSDANNPGWSRDSSVVRSDTGNGACEVVFVEEFEILKTNNPGWSEIHRVSRLGVWALGILVPLLWLSSVFLEQRR